MSFVHLHVHSQYSLLESTCDFDELTELAHANGMPAVALTDYGNMFGAVEFYFAAKKKGLKPLLGLEVYLAPRGRLVKGEDPEAARLPNRRLVLIAKNLNGYRNLCQISSVGYQEGFYYRPRIDDEILKKYSADLIVLSGNLMGDVPWTFKNLGADKARERISFYKNLFKDNFYFEICRTGLPDWKEVEDFLVAESKAQKIPIVATNDVHYCKQEDQVAQEVLICIGSNKTLNDPSRYRLGSDQFYFRTTEEMRTLFKDLPEACDNTLKIAEQCNVEFKLKDADGKQIYHLPTFPTEKGRTVTDEMRALAEAGLKQRLQEAKDRGEEVPAEQLPKYQERLKYELSIIDKMGFNGYFLIVQDFIGWAKEHDIPVGPGRGSGAGSLVAYSLGITDLDPLPYNLLFERFLNPERISMPDFDIDFCQDGRGRVIDYVTEKYGQKSVSQIITYGKLQARAAIRDVGRVLGMTFADVDVVSKLIPERLNITLKEAIDEEQRLRELMEDDPKIATLMDLAQKIEGLTRHAGIHAAGVVIAEGDLVTLAPLYRGADGENVIQYDMKHAEKIGLIKFDFLGLKTLTHIQEAIRLVRENRKVELSAKQISIKDKGIYELMTRGDTAGIFQFEGEGITDLMRKSKPSCFEDIVAINALYRPGPMDMIPSYLENKAAPQKIDFIFKELEDVLKETYGIIVYQEQVQLVAARIGGYSLGEADVLRRAMGKKIAEEMVQQRSRFLEGAEKKNFDLKKAGELFDLMAKFAAYGFNKSHAAAYCVIAAQTAYLKNYYPVEFFAALLSTEMGDTDKVVKYVKDARKHNISVEAPHVNYSGFKFSVKGDAIYFSLGALKGVGEAAVNAIIEAREALPENKFKDLEQFFSVVDLRRVNKKTIEALIKAGAMDGFGYNRAQLATGYTHFIERSEQARADKDSGQVSLFGISDDTKTEEGVVLDPAPEWGRMAKLGFEKEVLGFFLSGHPLDGIESLVAPLTTGNIAKLATLESKSKVVVLGLASEIKEIITKKGTRMAFANLEDTSGNLELVVFPDTFAQYEATLKSDRSLLVHGTLEVDGPRVKILVEKLQRAEEQLKQSKRLVLNLGTEHESKLALLKELFMQHQGKTQCTLAVKLKDLERVVEFELREPKGVEPSSEFFEKVAGIIESPVWSLH